MIEFAFPWAFLLLPAPLLVWRFAPPHRERIQSLRIPFFRRVTEAAQAEPRAGSVVMTRSPVQMIAAILCWGLIVLALTRPERVGEPIVIEKAARDMILAIDISGSMDDRDFKGADGENLQRLEAVKGVVDQFVADRDGDRIALIIFGTKAFVQAPFTEDLNTVRDLLAETEVGMAGPHTAVGDAIGLSIKTFESSDIDQRLLILLTDGADTGSRMSPVNAAEIASQEDVTIFTIGVGDPEGDGENRVDLTALEDIAARASGEFFFAGDQDALASVYARIDEMTPRETETLTHRPRQSLSHIALGLAALIGLGASLWLHLQQTRRRRRPA